MNHVMFDLETWGTRPGCALRSIGAVLFDPASGQLGEEFYANVGMPSYKQPAELKVEPSTVEWWMGQSEESKQAFKSPEPEHLLPVVDRFHSWFKQLGGEFIWCHGAAFDEPVWRVAALAVGRVVPWNFRKVRDTRTLFWLADFDEKAELRVGVEHNALDDAKSQARCVSMAMHQLNDIRLKAARYEGLCK